MLSSLRYSIVHFIFNQKQQKDTKTNLFEERTPASKSGKNRFIVEQLR